MHLLPAIRWFFKVLSEGEPVAAHALAAAPPPIPTVSKEPAIQLLAILQKEGRLVDFLKEDITRISDAEIGAAVRDIHRNSRAALEKFAVLRPVMTEAEGAAAIIAKGYDPSAIDLVGAVSGAGPWRGTVAHRGWYVEELKLPTVAAGADPKVLAPAQVEVR